MLLRTQRYYSTRNLITMYKQQVLSFVEYRTAAIAHASSSLLHQLDRVQERFLRNIGISEREAIVGLNLAPLPVRRDIALLGVIHRAALGCGPPHFQEWFCPGSAPVRLGGRTWHTKQIHDRFRHLGKGFIDRSVFGYIAVYNLLPQSVVDCRTLKEFQGMCQDLVRERLSSDAWKMSLSPRLPMSTHLLR